MHHSVATYKAHFKYHNFTQITAIIIFLKHQNFFVENYIKEKREASNSQVNEMNKQGVEPNI